MMKPPKYCPIVSICDVSVASRLILSLTFILLVIAGFSQDGPGGVGSIDGTSTLEMWLKANIGTNTTTNGVAVSSWADQSGNSVNATQGTGGNQPLFVSADANANNMPAIDFDGSDDYLDFSDATFSSGASTRSAFVITSRDGISSELYFFSYGTSSSDQRFSIGSGTSTDFKLEIDGDESTTPSSLASTGFPNISSLVYSGGGIQTNSTWHHDGTNQSLSGGADNTPNTTLGAGRIGARLDGLYWDGKVHEIIFFNEAMNSAKRILIENYLAAKYQMPISNDKYAEPTATTYTMDLVGIGRESDGTHAEAHSSGLILMNNSSLDTDGDYLMVGHNSATNSLVTTDLPSQVQERWERIWFLDKTGTLGGGNVQLVFDYSDGGVTAPFTYPGNYHLLKRSGTSGAFSVVTTASTTINGDQIIFEVTNANLSDANYYTIGSIDETLSANVGDVLINEVITDPQFDWSGGNFYNATPSGTAGTEDEWIELYIAQDGLNISTWSLKLHDGGPSTDLLNGGFGTTNYLSLTGGTLSNTKSGDYVILGDPSNVLSNDISIQLLDGAGDLVDQVRLGTHGDAPSGNANNSSDESIARIPGETDTDVDANDFSQTRTTLGYTNSTTGTVKINEVVTDPYQDWATNGFDGTVTGLSVSANDEWIELYIETAGINLDGWTIEMNDGTDVSGTLKTTGNGVFTTVNYITTGSGTFTNTEAGDYLILGNPTGAMNNTVLIILKDPSGTEMDRVQLGGAAGQAPSGANSSVNAESVCRYTNASDTDTDDVDFIQTISSLGATNSPSGTVLINEVVTNPQQDWSTGGFDGTKGNGSVDDGTDEWVELYIGTAGINLTNWTITLTDGTNVSGDLTAAGAFDVISYTGSGSFLSTAVGDYLVLGTVDGAGAMDDNVQIILRDAIGTIIDQVQLGGGAGEAPSGTATGNSDESVARIPNATDTNADDADFVQAAASMGAKNTLVSLPGPGNGLAFDGTADFITISDSDNSLDLSNTYTIEAWVYVTDQSNNTIIDKGDYNYLFQTHANGSGNTLGLYNNSMGWKYATGGSISTSTWTHVAVTFDTGTDEAIFYVNGVSIGTLGTVSNPTLDNGDINIGRQSPSTCGCNLFDGSMDELRIWNDVRSQEEILENMFTTLSGSETNLLAFYNFDQSSGTNLPDLAGSNDGTLTNMAGTEWTPAGWETFVENAAILQSGGTDVSTGTSAELTITDVAFLNDNNDFLLVGHDNSDFTEVTSDLPSGTLVTARYGRNWHLTKNDVVGTANGNVQFSFDLSATPNADYTYYLLERAGTSGDFSIVPMVGSNPIGNSVVFTVNASQLDNGSYYTIGRSDAGVGNALDFDGTDDYIVSGDLGVSITQKSFGAWVKLDNISQTGGGLITLELNDGTVFDAIAYNETGAGWGFGSNSYARTAWSGVTETSTSEWAHIAATFDNNDYRIYRNGVLILQTTSYAAYSFPTNSRILVGKRHTGGGTPYLDGSIDEVQVWNKVLSQAEIVDNMYSSLAGTEANLIAYYRMNDGIGDGNTSLPDLSGNGNGGTLTNFDNLNSATATSNYVTASRTTVSDAAYIVNATVDILTAASGELTLTSTTADFLQDTGDQITWGNDGGAFTETTADVPTGTLVTNRINKAWRVSKNDIVGTANGNLTFSFDLGTAPNSDYTYYLLTRSGTSGNFSVVKTIGSRPNGNSIAFTIDGAQLTSDNYFTLGRSDSGPGNALDFDGTDDNVTIADPGITFGTDLTLEAWVNIPGTETAGAIISHFNVGAPYDGFSFELGTGTAGVLSFYSNNGGGILFQDETSLTTINDGIWHHIAATFDGTNVNFYIDGVMVSSPSAPSSSISLAGNNIYIARDANPTINRPLNAQIDEVRIWSDARTKSEMEQNMHRSLDVANESNLVAYYKFDQGDAGGTNTGVDLLTDHSGNNNAGTLTNFALTGTSSNWVASEAVVSDANSAQALIVPGNALDFDGSDDFVMVSDNATIESSSLLTIEAWVNPNTVVGDGCYTCRYYTGGDASNVFGLYHNGGVLTWTVNQSDNNLVSANSTITASEWTHIAGVADGSQIHLYVNGILASSTPYDGTITSTSSRDLLIGKFRIEDGFGALIGQIDEVRIWNTARTDTQIQDNMYEELVGNETGLVAYFRFDEFANASNTTLYDETSNNNDGTLTSMDGATDWVDASGREAFKTTGPTNWTTLTTWKGGASPTANTDKVNLGHDVTFDATDEVLDLNVNSGSTLTIASGQTLTINGNLINNGTITGAGTIRFNTGSPVITGGTLNNIEVAGAITATLQGALTVNGTLNLSNGLLALDEFNLTLGSGGNITRGDATDYIQTLNQNSSGGFLIRQVANGAGQITFPIGTTTYTPFTMVNLGTNSNFGVRVFDGTYRNGTSGTLHTGDEEINKTWDVVGYTLGYNTTITIQWNSGDELGSFTRNNMFVSRNQSDGWWRPITGDIAAGGSGPYTASVSGVNSFSQIGGGSGSSPLPVELIAFEAELNQNEVELTWRTATEINNDRFEIERSADGKLFQKIHQILGHGNSTDVKAYDYTDRDPMSGLNYYRLKQVDFDGDFEYSPMRVVQVGVDFENKLMVYPNPSSDNFKVRIEAMKAEDVFFSVFNLSGQMVLERIHLKTESKVTEHEFGDQLEKGIYLIVVESGNRQFVNRIIKQ